MPWGQSQHLQDMRLRESPRDWVVGSGNHPSPHCSPGLPEILLPPQQGWSWRLLSPPSLCAPLPPPPLQAVEPTDRQRQVLRRWGGASSQGVNGPGRGLAAGRRGQMTLRDRDRHTPLLFWGSNRDHLFIVLGGAGPAAHTAEAALLQSQAASPSPPHHRTAGCRHLSQPPPQRGRGRAGPPGPPGTA